MNGSEVQANFTSDINGTIGNITEAVVPIQRIGSAARSDFAFYYQCVLAPIGVITNILNLICLRVFRKGAMNTYLTALAVIDLVFSLNLILSTYYRTLQYTESYYFALIYSKTSMPITAISGGTALWVSVMIAADRAVHVAWPFKAMVWVSEGRAKIILIVTLIFLVALRIPYFLFFTVRSGVLPSGTEVYWASFDRFFFSSLGQTLFIVQAALFEYIPCILLVLFNLVIVLFFRKYRRERSMMVEGTSSNNESAGIQQEYKLTLTLLIVIIVAVIGNVPVSLTRIIFTNPREGAIYKEISSFLFILDHTTNFFIYFLSNPEFRQAIRGYLPSTNSASVGKGGNSNQPSQLSITTQTTLQ